MGCLRRYLRLWVAFCVVAGIPAVLASQGVRDDPGGPGLLQKEDAGKASPDLPTDGPVTIRVLGLMRVDGRGAGFSILEKAGQVGLLVDELKSAGSLQDAPVYRFWGRVREKDTVSRFRVLIDRESSMQALWLAWAEIPESAVDPVPLTTVVWSPLLYPNRSSTLTRGPVGGRKYYIEPGSAAVLESTNNGKDFETAFSAERTPEFIEGGGGFDLTKVFWRAKVASWLEKQEDLRRKGYEKYGPVLQPKPQSADPE